MVNFVQVATLSNQTLYVTPRYAGQIVRLGTTDYTASFDGVPVRIQGTGAAYLGEGWWDELIIVAGNWTGTYFDGGSVDGEFAQYAWTGAANASTSTLQERTLVSQPLQSIWNVADYNVVEDSTPLDPSDTTGGFGQISLVLPEDAETKGMMDKPLVLTDGALGETTGTVRMLGGNGLSARVTANSRIGNLAVERTIQPFVGSLGDCLEYHLSLCGITSGIVIDDSFYLQNVMVPGGRANVYDRILDMCAAYNFEMSLVSNNITFRPPRANTAVNYRISSLEWDLDRSHLAQSVVGWNYNTWSGTDIAYPPQRNVEDADVYQVDAGEVKVYEVPLDASLSGVVQPIAVASVAIDDFSASQYTVSSMSTTEGVAMLPFDWTDAGGYVKVEIGEDTKVLIITIRGADLPELAPFRIAMPKPDGDFYSSLRVRGTGVFWRKQRFDFHMIEDQDIAPDEIGVEVDSPFMETQDQLYHRLLLTAERYSNDAQIIRATTGGINRLGESGSARYATIGDVNTAFPGATIGTIASELGPTIADWNAEVLALVSGDFANQAFGNVAGARVLHDNSYYRIRSATIKASSIEYTAERDNTIGDVYHYGETIGQWNARHAGKTIRDVNIAPLKEDSSL